MHDMEYHSLSVVNFQETMCMMGYLGFGCSSFPEFGNCSYLDT